MIWPNGPLVVDCSVHRLNDKSGNVPRNKKDHYGSFVTAMLWLAAGALGFVGLAGFYQIGCWAVQWIKGAM